MAKVWAIIEVRHTQINAWVMAVLAKEVGQVNGYFFQNLKIFITPGQGCGLKVKIGAVNSNKKRAIGSRVA